MSGKLGPVPERERQHGEIPGGGGCGRSSTWRPSPHRCESKGARKTPPPTSQRHPRVGNRQNGELSCVKRDRIVGSAIHATKNNAPGCQRCEREAMDGCRRSRASRRHATPHHATPRHDTMRWTGEGGSCYAAITLGEGADSPAIGRGTRSAVVAQPGHPCSLRRGGWAPCRQRVPWHGAPHRAAAAHQHVARWFHVAPPWHAAATTRRKACKKNCCCPSLHLPPKWWGERRRLPQR